MPLLVLLVVGVVAPSVRIAPASHSQLADATTEHRTVLEAQRSASEAKIATHAEATDAAERRARSRDAELEEAQLKLARANAEARSRIYAPTYPLIYPSEGICSHG